MSFTEEDGFVLGAPIGGRVDDDFLQTVVAVDVEVEHQTHGTRRDDHSDGVVDLEAARAYEGLLRDEDLRVAFKCGAALGRELRVEGGMLAEHCAPRRRKGLRGQLFTATTAEKGKHAEPACGCEMRPREA